MRHIHPLCEWQLQHLVPVCSGAVDDVHGEFACVFGESFKLEKLQLDRERAVVHFECADDLFIGDELMDDTVSLEYDVAIWVFGLKLPSAVFFIFQFEDVGSHPLSNNLRVFIRFEK